MTTEQFTLLKAEALPDIIADLEATVSGPAATAVAAAASATSSAGTASTSAATAVAQAALATASAVDAQASEDAAAIYASAAATAAKFYATIALGRAAVADTETFGVVAGGSDGLTYPTLYRRDSGSTQTLITTIVDAATVAAIEVTADQAEADLREYFGIEAVGALDTDDFIARLPVIDGGDTLVGGWGHLGQFLLPYAEYLPLAPEPTDDYNERFAILDRTGTTPFAIDQLGRVRMQRENERVADAGSDPTDDPALDYTFAWTNGRQDRAIMYVNRDGSVGMLLDDWTRAQVSSDAAGIAAAGISEALLPGNVFGGAGYDATFARVWSDTSGHSRAYIGKRVDAPVYIEENRTPIEYIAGYGDSLSQGSGGTPLRNTDPLTPNTGIMLSSGVRGVGDAVFVPASARDFAPAVEAVSGVLGTTGLATAMAMLESLQTDAAGSRAVWLARNSGLSGETAASLQEGDQQFENLIAEVTQSSVVAAEYGRDLICQAVYFNCGTNDRSGGVTKEEYEASVIQLISDLDTRIKAATGQTEDVQLFQWQIAAPLIYTSTDVAGPPALAQLTLGIEEANIHTIGPSYWVPNADNVHASALGHDVKGEYAAKAIWHYQRYGDTVFAPTVNAAAISILGSTITVPFWTVRRRDGTSGYWPLQFIVDDDLEQAPDEGFLIDDPGGAAIVSVTITNTGTSGNGAVTIVLDQAPAAGCVLEYAYTGTTVETVHSCAWGNLADTDTTPSITDPGRALINRALTFKEIIA